MLKKSVLILSIITSLFLVFIHFSSGINPIEFWPFAFFGLVYPAVLLLCLFFLIIHLLGNRKYLSIIPLIAIIITWQSNRSMFQVSLKAETLDQISLMSWNVKNFDLYNWSGNEDTRSKMLDLIEEENPDILCLQEFYSEDKGKFTNLKDIKKALGYKYHYFAKTYSKDGNRHWGMVIFSKLKIIDEGKLTFVKGTRLNTCIYVDLALSDTQIARVYNVHFQSNQLSQEDYKYLENPQDNSTGYSPINILRKLKSGYINRAEQVLQVMESKQSSPYPSIICGDFNDTPISYAYKTLSAGMQDAYVEKGLGFGKTYVNRTPFLRIDFALFHKLFKLNDYRTINTADLSDHYPIRIEFDY